MKTTSWILIGCVAAGLASHTVPAWAGPHRGMAQALVALAISGQLGGGDESSEDSRQEVLDLLARARQAMAKGNLESAESFLARAESKNVNFGVLHLGDTPKKVRRDLNKVKKTQGRAVADSSDVIDPFAARAGREGGRRGSVAGTDESFPAESPLGAEPAEGGLEDRDSRGADRPAAGSDRAASDELVLKARRALAVGDVRRSSDFVAQAKSLKVKYSYLDDSPAKVEEAIEREQHLAGRPAGGKSTEEYRRHYAEHLMQQAEALLKWKEFDEAERLCTDAKRLALSYNPFETNPDTLLDKIAQAKAGTRKIERLPPVDGGRPAMDRYAESSASSSDKAEVLKLVAEARAALAAGDTKRAEQLARRAEACHVPDSRFSPRDDRPHLVLLDVQKARLADGRQDRNVIPAGNVEPIETIDSAGDSRYSDQRAVYDRERDQTYNTRATAQEEQPPPQGEAYDLFDQGEEALRQRDIASAADYFRQAYQLRDDLDPATQQRLQDHLSLLAAGRRGSAEGSGEDVLDEAASNQQLLARQVSAELARQETISRRMAENDPQAALEVLHEARANVDRAGLDSTSRDILLRRVDRGIVELEQFISANKPEIDLAERNRATRDQIAREGAVKVEVQEKLAMLVEEFNTLVDERRYPEAELKAKQAQELAPDELVVKQIVTQGKVLRRVQNELDIREAKEQGFDDAIGSVVEAGTPFDDTNPILWGDKKNWIELTKTRRSMLNELSSRRSAKDLEIEQRLKTPVSLRYQDAPLSVVLENLAKLAQVNLYLDQRGLAEEGVSTETSVTIDLSQEIQLKSALNLILDPLQLSYVIKDEVLKITSAQFRDGEVYPVTYNVADLVIPIPNFVPSADIGLTGALAQAHAQTPMGWGGGSGGTTLPVLADNLNPSTNMFTSSDLLAQMNSSNSTSLGGQGSPSVSVGPGGAGGGAAADFDSLIELITTTVSPDSWDENGGAGAIQEFAGNLSLVISNTEPVHEQVADLLEQLRRLQDLQVTIEVRFITLNDNFFERIGVDFDLDVNDNIDRPFQIFGNPNPAATAQFPAVPTANTGPTRNVQDRDFRPNESVTVGLAAPGVFSADLDVPFTQGNFPLAVPQFGGFAPGSGAQLGFAILSDLEAYFFIEAAQGDRRSNVLQAPKVTLFNGQQAFVSDTSQSPFVISVIPVVGDFAAAQMPVIVVLNQGTHLTVQAVVSSDRRFVRLTVVPFFSRIGDVNTFTFTGSESTEEDSSSEGPDDETGKKSSKKTTSREGTTVQLPTFSFVTVTTTVSVPDGGTVLLGGIKRLSEGRNEFGVPMLSKIPYINRLFRNVGIGRETQSLMMMVTPRIIIQEEEEANILGGLTP